jgi:hypothetical protein
MTDRELLELAAKAAGYELVWGDKYKLGDDEIDCTDIPYIRSGQPDEGDIHWNPLADDGDALRLAVKLNMLEEGSRPFVELMWRLATEVGSDDFEAIRRAIVRAAAEIGRAGP